ncbi:MAG: WYL domain-containing protein [Deltaproteobacteria bacterium]|nr:WYL domain-containing protein [Deltaproteobacteria bacterium]
MTRRKAVPRKASREDYFERIWNLLRQMDEAGLNGATVEDLAGHMAAVDERTVRRYAEDCVKIGIVEIVPPKDKRERRRYRINDDTKRMWRLKFDPVEVGSIILGETVLRRSGHDLYANALKRVRSRIEETAGPLLKKQFDGLDRTLVLTQPTRLENLLVLENLHRALAESRIAVIHYEKPGAKVRPHEVKPVALIAGPNMAGGRLYLLADHVAKGYRLEFALPRIRDVVVTGTAFTPPDPASLQKELSASFGVFVGGKPEKVRIRFTGSAAAYAQEHQWHPSQKFRKINDTEVELVMTCTVTDQLVGWVLSFGSSAKVVGPRRLEVMVRNEAGKVVSGW